MSYSNLFNKEAEFTRQLLSMDGEALGAGVRASNNESEEVRHQREVQQGTRKKERSAWDAVIDSQFMDGFTDWLKEEAARLREHAKDERELITQNTARMIANSDFIGAGERLMDDYEDGKPVDPQKVVTLLRKRGVDVDDNTPLAVLMHTYLPQEMAKANIENEELEIDNEIHEQNAENDEKLANRLDEQAANIRQKVLDLRAQNPSEDDYNKGLEEIWDNVPEEIIKEYRNNYEQPEQVAQVLQQKQLQNNFSALSNNSNSTLEDKNSISLNTTSPPSLG